MTSASPSPSHSRLAKWIDRQPRVVLTIYAMVAAFLAYMSMYAFRKPWSADKYDTQADIILFGVAFGYKVVAAIAQLIGYMGSKFLGIKFASEATMSQRVPIVVGLILCSEIMLLCFAVVPAPYNVLFLILNGLPLGMVWSMLFGIVEGRKITEFLALGMSVSVIFSSAWVKDVGRWTMSDLGVELFWMPFVTGLIFLPVLALSMLMLWHVPPPTEEDIAARTEREPMSRAQRRAFVRKYLVGMIALVCGYTILMGYRNVRDDFMPDILSAMGYETVTFGSMENWVGVSVIVLLCLLWFVKSNRYAVYANLAFVGVGALLVGATTLMVSNQMIEPKLFYILNGIGLYMAYIPYQSIFMDRLLASLNTVATASFLIALGDAYGYLTVIATYIAKDIYPVVTGATLDWAQVLDIGAYVVLIGVPICVVVMICYFNRHLYD